MDALMDGFYFFSGFLLVVGWVAGIYTHKAFQWLQDNPPRGE